jgi:hypothetical protein
MNGRINVLTMAPMALIALVIISFTFTTVGSSQERQQNEGRPLAPTYAFEFEDLIATAKAINGDFGRQDMKSFGAGWSGDAQLFWKLGPCGKPIGGTSQYTQAGDAFHPGPQLTVTLNVPVAATYEVVLHYTEAPDFGKFSCHFDNVAWGAGGDAYAPQVKRKTKNLGQRQLSAGSHTFVVSIDGRRLDSTGCSLGLDRLDLNKVDTRLRPGPIKQVQKP